jgi:6-phosphofructokinase 1
MGRTAGHLALGIGKSAAATVTIIPEEFQNRRVTLDEVCDIVIGAIIKRKAAGNNYGTAILAEGLLESIGEEGLKEMISTGHLNRYGHVARDDHGHLRLGEIEFGRMIRDRLVERLSALRLEMSVIDKDLGYELRCADPIPFDTEYTRDLGFAAARFLMSEDSARFGAIISVVAGKMRPLPFGEMLNPQTKRMNIRKVDVTGEGYSCARSYMIRLDQRDFDEPDRLARLADAAGLSPDGFRERFGYLLRQ